MGEAETNNYNGTYEFHTLVCGFLVFLRLKRLGIYRSMKKNSCLTSKLWGKKRFGSLSSKSYVLISSLNNIRNGKLNSVFVLF